MPAKEIKELRQAGKLEDALSMARAELQAEPGSIWPKRNISWVYYDYLKQNNTLELFDSFIFWLNEIKRLDLPAEEKMLFEQLCWQIGKMEFVLVKSNPVNVQKSIQLFEVTESINFPKPNEGYSFLFKAFHKALKDTDRYIHFADWWGIQNFLTTDYEKEKLPNGKEIMSIVEQAYIAYAKHLLPRQTQYAEIIFDKDKAMAFLPKLAEIVDKYPKFQYPAYFNAKLLLAVGDKENMLEALLPFARKKRNDFWVWEILAEAFSNEPDKVFACYCKALSCNSPEEMLVSLRQKMAGQFVAKGLFNEAKTEIELLVKARNEHGFKIPKDVENWLEQEWFRNANSRKSNTEYYKEHISEAESFLFSDTAEELVIVDFVNSDKRMLNFIASESKFGFFKYDRFIGGAKIGDTLKVRFQGGSNEGIFQVYTVIKVNDESFRGKFIKEVEGQVRIPTGKSFGFLGDTFVHPSIINRMKLNDGMQLKGKAIKSFNKEKKEWGWKLM